MWLSYPCISCHFSQGVTEIKGETKWHKFAVQFMSGWVIIRKHKLQKLFLGVLQCISKTLKNVKLTYRIHRLKLRSLYWTRQLGNRSQHIYVFLWCIMRWVKSRNRTAKKYSNSKWKKTRTAINKSIITSKNESAEFWDNWKNMRNAYSDFLL